MSTYYDYYLEQKVNDGWERLVPIRQDDLGDSDIIYWHTRSYGSDFAENYTLQKLAFSEYSKKDILEYQDAYNKVKNGESRWNAYYPDFYLLDLETMIEDFNNNIHERAGIISTNDRLKLQKDSEYEPEVINPRDFNKLTAKIKDNYIYYAWDTPWSEYGHIYDIVPIVNEMLEHYKLKLDDVRLVYRFG